MEKREKHFKGCVAAPGIATGKAFFFERSKLDIPEKSITPERVEYEVEKFRSALQESRRDVEKLRARLHQQGAAEGAAILDCHLQMMEDPSLTVGIEGQIRDSRKSAPYLFQQAVSRYERQFGEIPDPFFRERVTDLQDVARRIFSRLSVNRVQSLADLPEGSIVFTRELFPSDTAEVESGKLLAIVTRVGGSTSHLAIMAKSLGIPYVYISSGDFPTRDEVEGSEVIVNGKSGEVIINPSSSTLSAYSDFQDELRDQQLKLESFGGFVPQTIEGCRVVVSANVQMLGEMELLHRYGGDGVGLFRSEYLCMSKEVFPSEEEQLPIYRELVERAKGLPVTIRTFDIGGDKFGALSEMKRDGHPFLSTRSMRYMLNEKDALMAQLRAILRASAEGDVRILFPMVTSIAELEEAKECVEEAKLQLKGEPFNENLQIGCMIEVPSAALTADLFAKNSDFLSIGTNDLVQYTLAVDRTSSLAADLYTPAHPGVLRLIKLVAMEAENYGVPLMLCGEMAADRRFTALLIGLGITGFSVSPQQLGEIKDAISKTSVVSACELADAVLNMSYPNEVLEALAEDQRNNSIGTVCAV